MKKLSKGREGGRPAQDMRPEGNTIWESFLGFFVCFIYCRLGAEETSNPEMPMGADKKSKTQQEPALSSHRTCKGQPDKTENL